MSIILLLVDGALLGDVQRYIDFGPPGAATIIVRIGCAVGLLAGIIAVCMGRK